MYNSATSNRAALLEKITHYFPLHFTSHIFTPHPDMSLLSSLTALGEAVDLPDGDDVSEDVAQPLRVEEVDVLQVDVVVV